MSNPKRSVQETQFLPILRQYPYILTMGSIDPLVDAPGRLPLSDTRGVVTDAWSTPGSAEFDFRSWLSTIRLELMMKLIFNR